jgi:transposase-like protein
VSKNELFPNDNNTNLSGTPSYKYAYKYNDLLKEKKIEKNTDVIKPKNEKFYSIKGQLNYITLHQQLRESFLTISSLQKEIADDYAAMEYIEKFRWSGSPICPFCGCGRYYKLQNVFETIKRTYKCANCKRKFNVKIGTIFENTKIPLLKWLAIIHKGVPHGYRNSSLSLSKKLCLTQKSVWLAQSLLQPDYRVTDSAKTYKRNGKDFRKN